MQKTVQPSSPRDCFKRVLFSLQDVKSEPVLVGVRHEDSFLPHAKTLVGLLKEGRPAVGLELPRNHRDTPGMAFFSELAEWSESRGFAVVPLEPELRVDGIFLRRHGALQALEAGGASADDRLEYLDSLLRETRFTLSQLESVRSKEEYGSIFLYSPPELHPIRGPYSPEAVEKAKQSGMRTIAALEFAMELTRTRSEAGINEIFLEANRDIDAHILSEIHANLPGLVVVGLGHSRNIRQELPGYRYAEFGDFI